MQLLSHLFVLTLQVLDLCLILSNYEKIVLNGHNPLSFIQVDLCIPALLLELRDKFPLEANLMEVGEDQTDLEYRYEPANLTQPASYTLGITHVTEVESLYVEIYPTLPRVPFFLQNAKTVIQSSGNGDRGVDKILVPYSIIIIEFY